MLEDLPRQRGEVGGRAVHAVRLGVGLVVDGVDVAGLIGHPQGPHPAAARLVGGGYRECLVRLAVRGRAPRPHRLALRGVGLNGGVVGRDPDVHRRDAVGVLDVVGDREGVAYRDLGLVHGDRAHRRRVGVAGICFCVYRHRYRKGKRECQHDRNGYFFHSRLFSLITIFVQ